MSKRKTSEKERVTRMEFAAVKGIREKMKTRPELEKSLRKDFSGTLKAEGIKIDDDFKAKVLREWRAGMKADMKRIVAENPKSKDWYLKRVVEGKPIKIHVKINRKTGKVTKTLKGMS
jgi:hypothetical protein